MADWRQYFTAAILTNDPTCIGLVLDEATKALDRRLDELSKVPQMPSTIREREEILLAAKRLLLIRAEAQEAEFDDSEN